VIIRKAARTDLAAIVALLVDDELGKGRESPIVDQRYEAAFATIDADPRNAIFVGECNDEVVACMQITYIPGLGRHGGERSLIESVRVRADYRGTGLGGELMQWAVDAARQRGCVLVQLTSDKRRADAHRFYTRLGFQASHEGMKLIL
jgi:GNAT superfamily N-acetyltransferase